MSDDDPQELQLRDALRALDARTSTSYSGDHDRVRVAAQQRRSRRVNRAGGLGAAFVAIAVVVAVVANRPGVSVKVTTLTSKPVTNTGPFQPVSASFVTPRDGWVLGVNGTCDSGECRAAMQRTADGGRTWQRVNAPAQRFSVDGDPDSGGSSTVRFSNTTDGYLAVAGKLWSTVDAGLSWAPVVFPGSTRLDPAIRALAVTDTNVIVVTGTQGSLSFTVESANLGATDWEVVGELPVNSPAPHVLITRAGADAWVGLNNRLTSEAGFRLHAGRWQRWSVPCAKQGLTASIAAASEMHLYAGCSSNAVQQTDALLLESTNGGASFHSETAQEGRTQGVVLGAFGDGTLIMQTEDGIVRSASTTRTRTWAESFPLSGPPFDFGIVGGASAYMIVASPDLPWRLMITGDAGMQWRETRFATDEPATTTSTASPAPVTATTNRAPQLALPAASDFPDLLVADATGLWSVSVKEKRLLASIANVQSAFRLRDGTVVFETQEPFGSVPAPREIWRWKSGAAPTKLDEMSPAALLGVGVANGHDAILLLRDSLPEEQVTVYDAVTKQSKKLGFGSGGDSSTYRASIGAGVLVESLTADLSDGVRYTNLDGTDAQSWPELTKNLPYPSYERTSIVVSPDGSRLAYLDGPPAMSDGSGPDPTVAWELVVVDRSGVEKSRASLANYMQYDQHLSLDFDGRWAVVSYSNGSPIVVDTLSESPEAREIVGLQGFASLSART